MGRIAARRCKLYPLGMRQPSFRSTGVFLWIRGLSHQVRTIGVPKHQHRYHPDQYTLNRKQNTMKSFLFVFVALVVASGMHNQCRQPLAFRILVPFKITRWVMVDASFVLGINIAELLVWKNTTTKSSTKGKTAHSLSTLANPPFCWFLYWII